MSIDVALILAGVIVAAGSVVFTTAEGGFWGGSVHAASDRSTTANDSSVDKGLVEGCGSFRLKDGGDGEFFCDAEGPGETLMGLTG